MANADLIALHKKWREEADKAQMVVTENGAPHNAVTKELMRLLVLEWTLEIDAAKQQ